MVQDTAVAPASGKSLESRIEAMYANDRLWAIVFVALLWLTILFVMLAVRGFIQDPAIEAVCWVSAFILLLFNTASIVAMIGHYARDKTHIYAVDIRHLDAGH